MLIDVTLTSQAGGWRCIVTDRAAGAVIADRPLGATTVTPRFPLPPREESGGWGGQPHAPLCDHVDGQRLTSVFEQVSGRNASVDDTRAFARYLFDTLLGDAVWKDIVARSAQAGSIELALRWEATEAELGRLPWEMMRSSRDEYLGRERGMAIVRVVAGSVAPPAVPVSSPPRVLFVIGTGLQNSVVRPGLEYLRMIQALEVSGAASTVRTNLIAEASPERAKALVAKLRPDVVHFICHGVIGSDGQARLEMIASEDRRRTTLVDAQAIFAMFDEHRPRVVVLNACLSAAIADAGQVTAPLAAQLVRLGIATVTGMAGRVSNQACRLFTRRFYESLVENGEIAHATSEGRRAALLGGITEPDAAFDWALPVIFFNDALQEMRLPLLVDEELRAWQRQAKQYQRAELPFCDRTPFFERLDLLVGDTEIQEKLGSSNFDMFVIEAEVHPDGTCGLSYLLDELAAHAIRDGHVVCYIRKSLQPSNTMPAEADALLSLLESAIHGTMIRFQLKCPTCGWTPLDSMSGMENCVECRLVRDANPTALRGKEVSFQGRAIREALQKVLAWGRLRKREEARATTRMVVIIDDFQELHPKLAETFLRYFIKELGILAVPGGDLRVVLGFTAGAHETPEKLTATTTINWLGNNGVPKRESLGKFSAADAYLAYEHFLLRFEQNSRPSPLAIVPARRDEVFEVFHEEIAGMPSKMKEGASLARFFLSLSKKQPDQKYVVPADDDAALIKARES